MLNTKAIISIAAVLVMCMAPAAILFSDDSDALSEGNIMHFYVQLKDETNSYSAYLPQQSVGVINKASFTTALNDALTGYGLSGSVNDGWVSSITANGVTYTPGTWGSDPYYGFAIYYLDGNSWKATNDYTEGSNIAIVFDKYEFAQPAEADKYYDSGYGYWTKLPSVVPEYNVEYKIFLCLNDGTHSYSNDLPTQYCVNVSRESYNAAFMGAINQAGLSAVYSDGWAKSITANGVTYTPGTWGSDPYYGFAQYYGGESWEAVSNYNEGNRIAFVFDKYEFSEPANADNYYNSGFGYWTKLPSYPASEPAANDYNLVIYIIVGVIIVGAIAAVVFTVKKKSA